MLRGCNQLWRKVENYFDWGLYQSIFTGTCFSPSRMQKIAELAQRRGHC